MTADRYALLHPPQVATTLRSLPRRFREAVAGLDDEAVRRRVDGHTVLDVLTDAACTLALLERTLGQILVHDTPTVIAAVVDADARAWPHDPHATVATLIDALTESASAMADQIDHAPTDAWARTATVAGGRTTTAIDVAREAARVGAEDLRTIEKLVPRLR